MVMKNHTQPATLIASLLITLKNMWVSKTLKELGSEYDAIPALVPAFSACLDRNIGECFVCTGELLFMQRTASVQINLQAVPCRQLHSSTKLHKRFYTFPFNNFHCCTSTGFARIRGY